MRIYSPGLTLKRIRGFNTPRDQIISNSQNGMLVMCNTNNGDLTLLESQYVQALQQLEDFFMGRESSQTIFTFSKPLVDIIEGYLGYFDVRKAAKSLGNVVAMDSLEEDQGEPCCDLVPMRSCAIL